MLAHLLADYPLQPDWMVAAKRGWFGRLLHVSVHWLTLTLLTLNVWRPVAPWLLAIAVLHFAIDTFKAYLAVWRPHWHSRAYLLDQLLHVLSLLVVTLWLAQTSDLPAWRPSSVWVVLGSGAVLVSHTWFVTERLLAHRSPARQAQISAAFWPRLLGRLLLFAAVAVPLLPGGGWLRYLFGALALLTGILLYGRQHDPRRWRLVDFAGALLLALGAAVPVLLIS